MQNPIGTDLCERKSKATEETSKEQKNDTEEVETIQADYTKENNDRAEGTEGVKNEQTSVTDLKVQI